MYIGNQARRLITRRPGTADRRRRVLELTATGRRLLVRANRATLALERDVLAALDEEERAALAAMAFRVWQENRRAAAS